jgi:aryl-alcohol dehydrogenase-like predicted oxidoreductase
MRYRRLGPTGLQVSVLALGCMSFGEPGRYNLPWSLDEDSSRPYIRQALEAGINFFDTANQYSGGGSEEILGRALRDFAVRDEVVVATKVGHPVSAAATGRGVSRKAIVQELDNSLRRLGTDYIDLYQLHRWDDVTPLEETLGALDDAVRAGKVRYLGLSNGPAWKFAQALGLQRQAGWARFVTMQNHYNLVYREEEREMMPLCADAGIGVLPWSPLAKGRLARPWGEQTRRGTDQFTSAPYADSDQAVVADVASVARERGVAMATVALAWTLAKPYVTAPIVGTTRPHHLKDALAALDLELTGDETEALERHYAPRWSPNGA